MSANPQRAARRLAQLQELQRNLESLHLRATSKLHLAEDALKKHLDRENEVEGIAMDVYMEAGRELRTRLAARHAEVDALSLRIARVKTAAVKQGQFSAALANEYPDRLARHLRRCQTIGTQDPLGRTVHDVTAAEMAAEEAHAHS